MDKKISLCISILFGVSISSFFSITFHVGWMFRDLDGAEIISLFLLGIALPFGLILVSGISEFFKNIVLISAVVLFVIASYFLLLESPNGLIPTNMSLSRTTMMMFFMTIGMATCMVGLSIAEMARLSRDGGGWGLFLLVSTAITGALAAFYVSSMSLGWLYDYLLPMIFLPGAVLLYFAFYNDRAYQRFKEITSNKVLAECSIKDKMKGAKIALVSIISMLNMGIIIGVNGLNLPAADYSAINWIFYLLAGAGGIVGFLIGHLFTSKIAPVNSSRRKAILSQEYIFLFLFLQSAIVSIFIFLELSIPGYHGSILAQVLDGFMFGVVFLLFFHFSIQQHPPRAHQLFHALLFFLGFVLLVVMNFVKGIPMKEGEFEDIAKNYLIYIVIIELVLFSVPIILTTITICIRVKTIRRETTEVQING
ncbi:MAG: hypothetical protein ACTSUE_10710 [Promethearchaeota archaeon]